MIGDNIQHDPNIHAVCRTDQALEFLTRAEVLIHLLPIQSTIAVVIRLGIMWYGRYPNSIEAHTLDVVELGLDACESTAAVLGQICTFSEIAVGLVETIGKKLVDRALLPLGGGLSVGGCE